MGNLGQNKRNLVQMPLTKLHEHLATEMETKLAGDILPVSVVQRQMDFLPMITELADSLVLFRFIVTLLAVALDAHRLIVPFSVATLLGLRDDMVTIHQNEAVLVRLIEEVNVHTTALVKPGQNLVAFTATTHTGAAVDGEGAKAGDTESAIADLHRATF